MLINAKLNILDQKMLWAEAVHTCECVHNGIEITNSRNNFICNFLLKKPQYCWFVLRFWTYFLHHEEGEDKGSDEREDIQGDRGQILQNQQS